MKQIIDSVLLLCLIIVTTGRANGVLWPCVKNENCSTVATATCSPFGLCQCPAGYVYSDDVSKCLKESLYGENCESSNQCAHMLTGSKCNKVCECVEGYTYIRGRCKQLSSLGSTCTDTSDCVFGYDRESVVCHQNICKCTEGYYQRAENICRKKSMNVGDPCIVNQDCQGDSLTCSTRDLECVKEKRLSKDIGVQTTFHYVEMKNATTSVEVHALSNETKTTATTTTTTTTTTTKDGELFGASCTTENAPCTQLSHSICVQGLCRCRQGYYPNDGICKAEIGEIASANELCEYSIRDEQTMRCTCPPNFYANNTLRECLKPSDKIGWSCTQHAQCSPFGAAHCYENKCQCKSYADFNEPNQLCIPKKGLGSLCTTPIDDPSDQCASRVPNSICIHNACVCDNNYVEINEACKPGQNAACQTNSDCALENAECQADVSDDGNNDDENNYRKQSTTSVCKCQSGFVHSKGRCLQKATEYNDECIDTDQCKPLLGPLSKCTDGKCGCEDDCQHTNGECNRKRDLDEECRKSSECFTVAEPENVECRNAVCTCKFGYERDVERQMCRAVKKKNSSSGRPSVMKVITLLLTSAAVLITSAALKEAYFP